MIEKIKDTTVYKSLKLEANTVHSYFFYSSDKELNNAIAMSFAKSLICENNYCNVCNNCKMFNSNSHPDVYILDKDSIKVEDANNITNKLATKPIIANKKLFIILNAENMNEIAQNKLLKSLEEPNPNTVFILTSTKTDKILPTVLSRVSKICVPKLNKNDKLLLNDEMLSKGIDLSKYIDVDIDLTEIINFQQNEDYKNTIQSIYNLIKTLNVSSDIPMVVSKLGNINKSIFFSIMQNLFLDALKNGHFKFDEDIVLYIKNHYSEKAIIKCVNLIEKAYIMQNSNVNFNYILDNLLFNILKEKFLCK